MLAGFRRHAAGDGMQRAFGTPSPEVNLGQKFSRYVDPTTFRKMTRRPALLYLRGEREAPVTGRAVKHAVFVGGRRSTGAHVRRRRRCFGFPYTAVISLGSLNPPFPLNS